MAMLDDWTAALVRELGLDVEVDVDEVLDLARVAAHEVARPAAPLTAFLVGYAAALAGGGPEVVRNLGDRARALATEFVSEDVEGDA
jgi:hypothetical protein